MTFLSRKLLPLYTKLKAIAVNYIHKFLALSDKDKKKILIITALVALSNFAYSLFSLYTLISFGIAFLSIAAYFKINLDAVRAKGLITYMPHKLQKALLQRSLFDIICDIWFIPRISIYIKAFILPLFIKIDPSEAIHQLEDLSIGARKVILTKGILNIMPNTVKTAMLPNHQPATAESDSSDESPEPEDQRDLVAEKNETSKSMNRVDSKKSFAELLFNNDTSHSNSHKTGSLILDSINNDSNVHHKAGGQNSTDEEGLVNHNISLSKQMELKKSLPSFADMNPLRTHLDYYGRPKTIQHFRHQKGKPVTKGRWSSLKEEEPLSLILNSSGLEKGKGGKPELSETWDRLEIFARKHREKQLRQKHMGKPRKIETQGVFQAVQNIATLLSKDAIMERLEEVNLFKVFLLSSLALLLHFTVSKKTKYWFYYALQIMMYVTGITLSTGSMALYIVKVRARYRQWKEEQEKEKEKEKQRNHESLEREDSE